jgi:hypothetical protein
MRYRGPTTVSSRWEIEAERAAEQEWRLSREVLAWHEAGHAVTGILVGAKIDRVFLRSDLTGKCRSSIAARPVAAQLIFVAAGGAAATLFLPGVENYDWHDRLDMASLQQHYGLSRGDLDLARRRARGLVLKYWRPIWRVAEALLAQGELSGREVEQLLKDFNLPRLDIGADQQPRNLYDNRDRASIYRTTITGTLGADEDGQPAMRGYRVRAAAGHAPLIRYACERPDGGRATTWAVDRRGRIVSLRVSVGPISRVFDSASPTPRVAEVPPHLSLICVGR